MKSYFSAIFGNSPIRPLQKHMEKVLECVHELVPLFEAVFRRDYETVAAQQAKVAALEEEADELKTELRLNLPSSLFMPVDRRDLLDQLRIQDMIANKAKDIAGLILGRRMEFPPEMGEDIVAFLRRCIDCSAQALSAVQELDELVEVGFRGQEVEIVHRLLDEVSAIEKETDGMQITLRAKLRDMEKDLPAVDVIFLYKIIEWTGDLADDAERVGSRLLLMLAR